MDTPIDLGVAFEMSDLNDWTYGRQKVGHWQLGSPFVTPYSFLCNWLEGILIRRCFVTGRVHRYNPSPSDTLRCNRTYHDISTHVSRNLIYLSLVLMYNGGVCDIINCVPFQLQFQNLKSFKCIYNPAFLCANELISLCYVTERMT